MPDAMSDAFLQGQGVPVDPRHIEDELVRLWGPAAESLGGPEAGSPTVTRLVLANLVVATRPADAARIEATLDTVVTRYPCRAIVLLLTEATGRQVEAEVSALCHLPAPGLPQVCSERIVLRAGEVAADLVPGAVRSLLVAELPFVLWWTYDPRAAESLFVDLGDECSRAILDLPDPCDDPAALRIGLDPERIRYVRDIAWFGIARWRELVAQFFDGPGNLGTLKRIESVEVRAEAPDLGHPPRAAAWLIAWLAGQLGWTPVGGPRAIGAGGDLDARFASPSGEVAVRIRTEAKPEIPFARLTGVELSTRADDGSTTYRLARPEAGAAEVRVEIDQPTACVLPRLVHAPTFDAARRVAAALESSRDDPPFRNALPHLFWLLGVE